MTLPLEGIVVVACEQAVSAPLATRHLADLGARVIKIERPEVGDFARDYDTAVNGMSSHFVWLNRSKESVALDLKAPDARSIMHAIIAKADVFVQNFAPGAVERLGLGAADLRRDNPRLITCSISGYGSGGPYGNAKAYDLLIQAEAGLISLTGTEGEPARAGIPVADISAGMFAYSAILAALYGRQRSGTGTEIEINMFDSLVEWLGFPMHYTRHGGTRLRRTGTSHASIVPYGSFRGGDGAEFVIAVQNDREWARLCTSVLERDDLIIDPRTASLAERTAHRELVEKLVSEGFLRWTGAELRRRLDDAGLPYAQCRDITEVISHPEVVARQRWTDVQTPVGPTATLRPALTAKAWPERIDPVPGVGEHTRQVLEWAGIAGDPLEDPGSFAGVEAESGQGP